MLRESEAGGRMKEVISGGFAILFQASVTLLEHASLRHTLSQPRQLIPFFAAAPIDVACNFSTPPKSFPAVQNFTYATKDCAKCAKRRFIAAATIDFYSKQLRTRKKSIED
jgi:hypothetical protein